MIENKSIIENYVSSLDIDAASRRLVLLANNTIYGECLDYRQLGKQTGITEARIKEIFSGEYSKLYR